MIWGWLRPGAGRFSTAAIAQSRLPTGQKPAAYVTAYEKRMIAVCCLPKGFCEALRPLVALTKSLTGAIRRSTFVLMEVETLGVARSLGWKVHMRLAGGY
jgi:hypothetical protein